MLTKAYIEKRIDTYSYKVRMVFYNGISSVNSGTTTDMLYTAYVCCLPGITPSYEIGDVVYVEMEDDRVDAPVILGQLYRPENTLSSSSVEVNEITIHDTCKLPENTELQGEDSGALKQLSSGKLQNQINILKERIDNLSSV